VDPTSKGQSSARLPTPITNVYMTMAAPRAYRHPWSSPPDYCGQPAWLPQAHVFGLRSGTTFSLSIHQLSDPPATLLHTQVYQQSSANVSLPQSSRPLGLFFARDCLGWCASRVGLLSVRSAIASESGCGSVSYHIALHQQDERQPVEAQGYGRDEAVSSAWSRLGSAVGRGATGRGKV
jgi:hypothetical protein